MVPKSQYQVPGLKVSTLQVSNYCVDLASQLPGQPQYFHQLQKKWGK